MRTPLGLLFTAQVFKLIDFFQNGVSSRTIVRRVEGRIQTPRAGIFLPNNPFIERVIYRAQLRDAVRTFSSKFLNLLTKPIKSLKGF